MERFVLASLNDLLAFADDWIIFGSGLETRVLSVTINY